VWRHSVDAGDYNRDALRVDAPALVLRGSAIVPYDHFPERDPMSARSGLGQGFPFTFLSERPLVAR